MGHYFSVILPGREGADVLVANYHAPRETDLEGVIAVLHRFGVKGIKLQRETFDPCLYFRLLSLAKFGELGRMPQFKSADEKHQTGQLLTYPVLMTHDVAGYTEVLVGEDQKPHVDYARNLLKRFNDEYGESVRLPKASAVGGRIRDLRNPAVKMSKSSPAGCLFLNDSPGDIHAKLRAATTTAEGVCNLSTLYTHFVGGPVPDSCSVLKSRLSDAVADCLHSDG